MPKPPENMRSSVTPPVPVPDYTKERKLWMDLARRESFDSGMLMGLVMGFLLGVIVFLLSWGGGALSVGITPESLAPYGFGVMPSRAISCQFPLHEE